MKRRKLSIGWLWTGVKGIVGLAILGILWTFYDPDTGAIGDDSGG